VRVAKSRFSGTGWKLASALSFPALPQKNLCAFYNKIKHIVITILLLSFAGLCYRSRNKKIDLTIKLDMFAFKLKHEM